MNYEETIINCKKNFSRHELKVICDNEKVKRFQFRRPDSGCYGFNLTTADNLIVMNGDTYTLIIEPGYGREGLGFLLGSINSLGYFLSKCPFRSWGKDVLTEFSHDKALENLKYYIENEYVTKEQVDDICGLDDGEWHGEHAYYEFCNKYNIDEPMSPRVLTHTTLNQVAGLRCFAEQYEKFNADKSK